MTATKAEDAALSAAEIVALNAGIAARLRDRASLGAHVAVPPAPRAPGDGSRRPLGLAPANDDGHEAWTETPREPPLEPPPRRDPGDDRAAWLSDLDDQVVGIGRFVGEEFNDLERRAKRKFDEARNLISELRGELIEARHEIRELKLIQESLRISTRGESGRDGARGVPGRDGLRGEVGSQGPPGPRGAAAPAIAAWEIDDSAFVAYPLLANGRKGPGLHLRGMFEVYNAQVDASDAAAEIDAAAASRARTDREVDEARRALR